MLAFIFAVLLLAGPLKLQASRFYYNQVYSAEDCTGDVVYSEGYLSDLCFPINDGGIYKSFLIEEEYDSHCNSVKSSVKVPWFSQCTFDGTYWRAGFCSELASDDLPINFNSVVASYQNDPTYCNVSNVAMFEAYATDTCFPYNSAQSVKYKCDYLREEFTSSLYEEDDTCAGFSTDTDYLAGCYNASDKIYPPMPDYNVFNFTNLNTTALGVSYSCVNQDVVPTSAPTFYATLPTKEYEALHDLYIAADGDYWIWQTPYETWGIPWNFSTYNVSAPCDDKWQGVFCYAAGGGAVNNVEILILPMFNLTGTLPASLANLTELTLLELDHNNVYGTLPPELSTLRSLQYLYLQDNALTGTLPNAYGELSSLLELSLGYNHIRGSIPNALCNLTQLQLLSLVHNNLTGTIPSDLGHMAHLNELSLFNNYELTGSIPASVGELVYLEYLYVSECNITGSLPASLCSMEVLNFIDLGFNALTGTLPQCIEDVSYLIQLVLNSNHLRGTIPASITQLQYLMQINLNDNQVTGTLPSTIGNLRLQDLLLKDTLLNGSIPESLGDMDTLTEFQISSPHLTGTLPASLCNLTSLLKLSIYDSNVYGAIPDCIGNVATLETLIMFNNHLSGTLPPSLGALPKLFDLELGNNSLTGTIPAALGNCSILFDISLSGNNLNGTLPAELSQLRFLEYLDVAYNNLTGMLPAAVLSMELMSTLILNDNQLEGSVAGCITNMTSLFSLILNDNLLTGTLPQDLLTLDGLEIVIMGNNYFSGPLPGQLRDEYRPIASNLITYEVSNNAFTGAIPETYCELKLLQNLDVNGNMLNGSIPECIFGNLTLVNGFDLSSNDFTGTISSAIGNNQQLSDFIINNNYFTGSIPVALMEMADMHELLLEFNYLSGTIPQTIGNLAQMTYFGVQNNLLHGTIPAGVANLTSLTAFDVSDNDFYGSLPAGLGAMTSAVYFDVSGNEFTGTLPPAIKTWSSLELLLAGSNKFSGQVANIFDASVQTNLSTVDLSFNQFSGTLPANAFVTSLQNFVAVSNCFSGRIPSEICNAQSLIVLALDGIAAASDCQRRIISGVGDNTYVLKKGLTGGVPECVYSLPELTTLHLSGNALTGSIPSSVTLGARLNDLSLANNVFTGKIPGQVQSAGWSTLDLSYNKFTGTMDTAIRMDNTNATLNLEVNRLSGSIPSSVTSLQDVSVLDGNMFACDYDKSSLPRSDSDYTVYECGSNSFDWSVYLWMALTAVAAGCTFLLYRYHFGIFTRAMAYVEHFRSTQSENFQYLHTYDHLIRTYAILGILSIALVLIVIYGALTAVYHTYTFEYAWTLSAAYLSGLTPGIVLFMVFGAVIVIMESAVILKLNPRSSFADEGDSDRNKQRLHFYGMLVVLFCFNFGITVMVNAAYVYIAINYNTTIVTVTQLAMAMYKLLWNRFSVPTIMRELVAREADDKVSSADFVLQCMELLNNIIAPCVATAVISSDCFYNVFVTPPQVSASYSFQICSDLKVHTSSCTEFTTVSSDTSYTPPFNYSYQCSSALVTNYAAVFVYMFVFTAFGKPVLYYGMENAARLADSREELKNIAAMIRLMLPLLHKPLQSEQISEIQSNRKHVFDRTMFLISLYSHLAILFTFGVVFPPLMFVIGLSLWINSYYNEFLIGRCQERAQQAHAEIHIINNISHSLRNLDSTARASLLFILYFSAFFYSLFLFDTFGDKLGWQVAMEVMVIMIALPYLVHALVFMVKAALTCDKNRGGVQKEKGGGNVDDEPLRMTFTDSLIENPMLTGKTTSTMRTANATRGGSEGVSVGSEDRL